MQDLMNKNKILTENLSLNIKKQHITIDEIKNDDESLW